MKSVQNETMSWYQFLVSLQKQWGKLLLAGVGGCLLFLLVTIFLIPNKYNSTVDLLVNQKNGGSHDDFTAQQADLQVINTYKDILKKEVILEPVLQEMRAKHDYQGSLTDLRSSLTITNETDSQVLSVNVADRNPVTAAQIANTVGKVFTQKIKQMMKVDNVTIVTKGSPAKQPSFPNRKMIALAGLVVGVLVEILSISLRAFFDKTVKDATFLSEQLGLTNLGTVYHMEDERNLKVINIKSDQQHSRKRV